MKQKLSLIAVLAISLCAIWFAGCTTPNPNYNPNQPPSASNPPFSPDPRILSVSNAAAQLNSQLAPVNPYSDLSGWAVKLGFGALGLISGAVGSYKDRQAIVNAHAATISTLADGIVKAGSGQAVLDHASSTDNFAAVATAINASTGANQTAAGTVKTA